MSETDDLDPAVTGPGEDAAADEANEANEADAAEQRAAIGEEEGPREWSAQVPDDVNEADAVEQRFEVPLDEDDYR
ncbi:hypothetical protein [Actinomadura sp. 6K520]|jgi:hypothetical protein|uniref:hypothetical protein n=1 Tax=Actinomadura sp. 6K520 TaxID=2530364 RepID=UPI0010537BAF|nr:hypothetical protein [Actinomadura sp. 6K520]TDE17842.1 hypothetical protein E1289_35750 [Actinomadura sp. 6K520]